MSAATTRLLKVLDSLAALRSKLEGTANTDYAIGWITAILEASPPKIIHELDRPVFDPFADMRADPDHTERAAEPEPLPPQSCSQCTQPAYEELEFGEPGHRITSHYCEACAQGARSAGWSTPIPF